MKILKATLGYLAIMGISGCHGEPQKVEPFTPPSNEGWRGMFKATFDGHTFIVLAGSTPHHFIHHPDCPCQKKP